MSEITTIGLDLAKSVFQVHGINEAGGEVTRKRLRRGQMLTFFAGLPPCLVGMEACATAHYWARELRALGHEVHLMPPQYVKAYLKRNKNDAADAEAICEAVRRPSMRFVPVKTKEQQSALVMHRGRELLIRRRTMLANALRGHLAEFGLIAAQGLHNVAGLIAIVRNDEDGRVPDMARRVLRVIADAIATLDTQIAGVEAQIMAWQEQPYEPALGGHPRHRADHRHRHCGDCRRAWRVPRWPGVRCMARSCAATELLGRQNAPLRDQQTRQLLSSAPARQWRPRRAAALQGRQGRSLADRLARPQTAPGCRRSLGE